MKARTGNGRGERGIALVTVVVVLVALTLIATPFALSMRNLEAGALLDRRRAASLSAAEQALAAARLHLADQHPAHDVDSPHADALRDISAEAIAGHYPELLPRDPRGSIRSVHVEDESGKVHLGTAGPALLGNLLGGRTWLTAAADEDSTVFAVASAAGFPDTGFAWIEAGGEQVAYNLRTGTTLDDVVRGAESANLPRARAASHALGSSVYDARVLLLVQYGWHARPGVFVPFTRVDGLRDLARFSELTYDAGTLDRVRPHLTVHGTPTRWEHPERVVGTEVGRSGRTELVVKDGRRLGPGTVVQLEDVDGALDWNLIVSAVDWGDAWRLGLLEVPGAVSTHGELVVSALHREPVNIAAASQRVLEALLTGIGRQPVADVVTEEEGAHLAVLLVSGGFAPTDLAFQHAANLEIDRGTFSEADLAAVTAALVEERYRPGQSTILEMAARLVGLETRGGAGRIGQRTAQRLAQRLANARPASHEELADLLSAAVAQGDLDPEERTNILRNALDPGDARLSGGTAPFVYDSAGLYTIRAAASENLPNGRERSRAMLREIVSVAPPGDTARLVSTQADFEALMDLGSDWASRPFLMNSGPGSGTPPDAGRPLHRDDVLPTESVARLVADDDTRDGASLPGRAGTVIAGRPGPSQDEDASLVALASVRSALPGTLHFDEGAPELTADSPDGFPLEMLPLRLPIDGLDRGLLGAQSGLIQPFFVEFWFQVADAGIEAVLFDTGVDVLENRIDIMLRDGELSLRVSDGSITDFESRVPDGRRPPAGEIRYAFDDGLELLADVPYHVAALVSGSHDNRIALFVDGIPRGRRVFTTWLTDDMGLVGALAIASASSSRTERMPVESTEGFPDRGVLRVGWEIVEYTDKTEDTFILRPDSGRDPFGGRSRRGTVGGEHEAGETVELMGYSRPVSATVVPLGNGSLTSRLGEWGVAELDPDELSDSLYVDVLVTSGSGTTTTPLNVEVGTGLLYDATTIPVRGTGGGSLNDMFQESGGHALIFCDYGEDELTGQLYPIPGVLGSPAVPGRFLDDGNGDAGSWVGGGEVVRYDSFDGSNLLGCDRAVDGIPVAEPASLTSPLAGATSPSYVLLTEQNWDDERGFVTTFDSALRGVIPSLPSEARVLVIPLSLDIEGASLNEEYNPFPDESRAGRSPLVQVGIDFPDEGGGTEWIRWTTPTADFLVRDDKQAVEDMLGSITETSNWLMDRPLDPEFADDLNDLLLFRGQGGTEDVEHEPDDTVLPVHVLGAWGVREFDPALGIPGRHDATTLMGDDGEREWHEVNHAVSNDPEWGTAAALVGFREPVIGDFGRTAQTTDDGTADASVVADRDLAAAMQPGAAGERLTETMQLSSREALADAVRHLNVDSRRVTRLLKAPSGELPDAYLEVMHLGERSFDQGGRPTDGVRIDELRVLSQAAPGPLVPAIARYRLADDLELEQDVVAGLSVDSLLYPHSRVSDGRLGAEKLEVLAELPQWGGLLLVDEEIIGYAGIDPVDSGALFLAGRGLFGTRRARHVAGAAVTSLDFWPASPLVGPLGETEARIQVADPSLFPSAGGLVWIGDELLAYDAVADDGLTMPTRMGRAEAGLLRGRFGTRPAAHPTGAIVRWMPARVADRSMLGEEVPEAEALHLPIHAPGAFFTDVVVQVRLPDERLALSGRVAVDGLATRHDDPARSPDLFRLPERETAAGLRQLAIGRQGDVLDLWLTPRWLSEAFDTRDFASHAWKLGPLIDTVIVGHIQPSLVFEHEEWR